MTIAQMVSKQTRIERQDKPKAMSLSFDASAANVFQACVAALPRVARRSLASPRPPVAAARYVSQALQFSIQRGGYLFGEITPEGCVLAHVVYEPPQQGSVDSVVMSGSNEEERAVAHLATHLGRVLLGSGSIDI
jgi:nuclear protein localization family protein 4